MKIIFIRHGKTYGNTMKRYIGKTDEPLCEEGIRDIKNNSYPDCELVISSSMKRCVQTASLIYPEKPLKICDDLRECDFGDFEGKNYFELNGNDEYQRWIDSGGRIPFPNGESNNAFKLRCIAAFEKMVSSCSEYRRVAFVVHGGTIMSILEKYALPKKNYYDYMIENGRYFLTEFNGYNIKIFGD